MGQRQKRHRLPFVSVIDGVSVEFLLILRRDLAVLGMEMQIQDIDAHRRTLAQRKLADINSLLAVPLPWDMLAETTRHDRTLLGRIIQDADAQRAAVKLAIASLPDEGAFSNEASHLPKRTPNGASR